MLIRSTLAVLDFNNNINRKGKTSTDGKQLYKMKVKGKGSFNIKKKSICYSVQLEFIAAWT